MFARAEKSKLTLQERGAIIALRRVNVPISVIARDYVPCDIKTIKLWLRRFDETGDVKRKIGSGRPRITGPQQDEMLVDAVRAKPITTAQEIMGN